MAGENEPNNNGAAVLAGQLEQSVIPAGKADLSPEAPLVVEQDNVIPPPPELVEGGPDIAPPAPSVEKGAGGNAPPGGSFADQIAAARPRKADQQPSSLRGIKPKDEGTLENLVNQAIGGRRGAIASDDDDNDDDDEAQAAFEAAEIDRIPKPKPNRNGTSIAPQPVPPTQQKNTPAPSGLGAADFLQNVLRRVTGQVPQQAEKKSPKEIKEIQGTGMVQRRRQEELAKAEKAREAAERREKEEKEKGEIVEKEVVPEVNEVPVPPQGAVEAKVEKEHSEEAEQKQREEAVQKQKEEEKNKQETEARAKAEQEAAEQKQKEAEAESKQREEQASIASQPVQPVPSTPAPAPAPAAAPAAASAAAVSEKPATSIPPPLVQGELEKNAELIKTLKDFMSFGEGKGAYNKAKDLAKEEKGFQRFFHQVFKENKARKRQYSELDNAVKKFTDKGSLSEFEAAITKLKDEVGKEHNTVGSRLDRLLTEMQKKIDASKEVADHARKSRSAH